MGIVLPQSCLACGGAWARFGLWKGPPMERGQSIELLTKTPSCGVCRASLLEAQYLSYGVCPRLFTGEETTAQRGSACSALPWEQRGGDHGRLLHYCPAASSAQ